MADELFWAFVVCGGMMTALGIAFSLGLVPGLARHNGWFPIAFGVGFVLDGIAHYRNLGDDDWLRWVAVGLVFLAILLQWRSYRLNKASWASARTRAPHNH